MAMSMRSTPVYFKQAILHAIGQLRDMQQAVTFADIATFCKCQKATAIRYCEILNKDGSIEITETEYRKNVKRSLIRLSQSGHDKYVLGCYRCGYELLMEDRGLRCGSFSIY